MPEVTVDIAGRNYRLGCGEGEEVHLVHLAELVDKEASRLMRQMGQLPEGRLMLMSALMLADKLSDNNAQSEAVMEAQAARDAALAKAEAMAERAAAAEAASEAAAQRVAATEERATSAEEKAAENAQALADFQEEQATKYGPQREAQIADALDALAARIEKLTDRVEVSA